MYRSALLKCIIVLLCLACTQAPPGRKLASGRARGLIARDGAVAFLLDASHPDDPAVPDDLLSGDLWLDDRKAGSGVSMQEGTYAFSPRGSDLAFLARWRFREGEGENARRQRIRIRSLARREAHPPAAAASRRGARGGSRRALRRRPRGRPGEISGGGGRPELPLCR